jgi:hypothetical protein
VLAGEPDPAADGLRVGHHVVAEQGTCPATGRRRGAEDDPLAVELRGGLVSGSYGQAVTAMVGGPGSSTACRSARASCGSSSGRGLGAAALELTARHPYADAGYADFYHPGRWDCESDLVSIHQVGASVGEWDGTVGYARFTAPAAGSYLVVVNFSGYQQTMSLNGPWGTSTAHTATTSDSSAATAIWDGAAGQTLYCTFSSRSDDGYAGIAYLDSLQILTPA